MGLFDQQEIQVEVHTIKALKFDVYKYTSSQLRSSHSNSVVLFLRLNESNFLDAHFLDNIIYLTYTNK